VKKSARLMQKAVAGQTREYASRIDRRNVARRRYVAKGAGARAMKEPVTVLGGSTIQMEARIHNEYC